MPELVVHGLLVAERSDQAVTIEYTRPIEDGYYKGLTPVGGATVTISSKTGVFQMIEDSVNPGIYRGSFIPKSGRRYTLKIETREGMQVTAETIVPGVPKLVLPASDTSLIRDSPLGAELRIVWTDVAAAGYIVVREPLAGTPVTATTNLLQTFRTIRSDTAISFTVGSLIGDYPAGNRLSIAAIDSNYAAYVANEPLHTRSASLARSTIEDAYGIFGSIAFSETRRVRVES